MTDPRAGEEEEVRRGDKTRGDEAREEKKGKEQSFTNSTGTSLYQTTEET